jgi:hypothetical protein
MEICFTLDISMARTASLLNLHIYLLLLYAAAVVFLEAERSRRNYYLVETTHGSSGE